MSEESLSVTWAVAGRSESKLRGMDDSAVRQRRCIVWGVIRKMRWRSVLSKG